MCLCIIAQYDYFIFYRFINLEYVIKLHVINKQHNTIQLYENRKCMENEMGGNSF